MSGLLHSVTGRLVIGFALVLSIVLALLASYVSRAERASVLDALDEDLRGVTALLAQNAPVAAIQARDQKRLDAWADKNGKALGRRVTVIAPDGVVLGDSEVPLAELSRLQNHSDRPEVIAARAGGTDGLGSDVRKSASVGVEYLYVARTLEKPPGAIVRVALPVATAREHVRRALSLLWALAGGALVGGIGLTLWRTRPLSRRLRAFEEVARRIEGGDLSARAPEDGRDEITEVARMVNRMAEGLSATLGRVEEERDLREEMLSAMTDAVVLLDPRGGIVHANAALPRALGRIDTPRAGESFVAWCGLPQLERFLADARFTHQPLRREIRLRGSLERTLDAIATRMAEGSTLVVMRDLTPLKRLERVRQDFVANVSHELKTPLTSILGYAETLLDGGLDDPDHRRGFVDTIRDQAARLTAIVEDLLALSELDRPDAALVLAPVDVAQLARAVTVALEPRALKDGLTLTCETPNGELVVLGERGRLEQLLFNLVDNALKYTREGGVTVRVARGQGSADLVVEDTGPGIPREALGRIFERFYRVDAARSSEVPGTGLGLSIVRHIVELHHGWVEVANRPEGGARFTVRLPLAG
jgi:two-component system phosphate regulon sensor histidine kinase PhoR